MGPTQWDGLFPDPWGHLRPTGPASAPRHNNFAGKTRKSAPLATRRGGGGRSTDVYAAFCGQPMVDWYFCEPKDPQAKGGVERDARNSAFHIHLEP